MKRFFYLLPAVMLAFAACGDSNDDDNGDGDGNGNGNAGGGNLGEKYTLVVKASEIKDAPKDGEIDAVKLVGFSRDVHATSQWNDGFSLEFPETIPSSKLIDVLEAFDIYSDDTADVEISDENAKAMGFWIEGHKDNDNVGDFYYYKPDPEKSVELYYYYSDRDVTVKGEYVIPESWRYTFDISLKKGWNRVLRIAGETETPGMDYDDYSSTFTESEFSWTYERF